MSNGILGGNIGRIIDHEISSKFGKQKSNIIGGIISAIIGIILFLTYLFMYEPISQKSLVEIQLNNFQSEYIKMSKLEEIVLKSNDNKYYMNYSLWSENYKSENMINELQNANECKIWLIQKSNIILGIKTNKIFISPRVGVNLKNKNRTALLILSIFFFCLGIGYLIYEVKIKNSITSKST